MDEDDAAARAEARAEREALQKALAQEVYDAPLPTPEAIEELALKTGLVCLLGYAGRQSMARLAAARFLTDRIDAVRAAKSGGKPAPTFILKLADHPLEAPHVVDMSDAAAVLRKRLSVRAGS